MRTLFGLALAGAFMLGHPDAAQAQGPSAPYPYRFKDEPLMSINRSYLGYSNFNYYGPDPALGAYTTYRASRPQTYVQAPASAPVQVPARRGFRLFGGRRGYRY
jgi:hypothetical protein